MAAAKQRGAWSDTLPSGSDIIGQGFPDYIGGAFVKETQTIGDAPDACADPSMSDFQRGLCRLGNDPLGGAGGVLGNIFGDPLGTLGKGVGTVAGGAGNVMAGAAGEFWEAWGGKIVLGIVGLLFLAAGIWSLMKGTPVAEGVREGIRDFRNAG